MNFRSIVASAVLVTGTLLASLGVGLAGASPLPAQVNVTAVTSTSVSFNARYAEDVQIYTVGTLVQTYRVKNDAAGLHTVTGLKAGTAYELRAERGDWTVPVLFITTAEAGAAGSNGSAGSAGETLVSQTALSANAAVATGGPFLTNATVLGSVTVKTAGEYRVSVNAKVAADSTTQEVFPLIAVYNGVALADYSNDLFNLGDGALPLSKSIDQYIVGSQVVSLPAGTLKIYGFGYTPGGAAGTFNFEGATVTLTAVTAS